MSDFKLLGIDIVTAIHEEQLAIHGGGIGLRDRGLLESALARPANKLAYEPDTDCAALAASYAFGLTRNHPFIDGNKRTALVAMILCLSLNGAILKATNEDKVIAMLRLASGDDDEDALAEWIRVRLAAA